MPRMLNKDRTGFMQRLSRARQNQARERTALLTVDEVVLADLRIHYSEFLAFLKVLTVRNTQIH